MLRLFLLQGTSVHTANALDPKTRTELTKLRMNILEKSPLSEAHLRQASTACLSPTGHILSTIFRKVLASLPACFALATSPRLFNFVVKVVHGFWVTAPTTISAVLHLEKAQRGASFCFTGITEDCCNVTQKERCMQHDMSGFGEPQNHWPPDNGYGRILNPRMIMLGPQGGHPMEITLQKTLVATVSVRNILCGRQSSSLIGSRMRSSLLSLKNLLVTHVVLHPLSKPLRASLHVSLMGR